MNWVLAVFCLYFYQTLRKNQNEPYRYWTWFFLLFAISFFFGGISHLFFEYLGMNGKIPGWSAAALAVSSGELAMIAGTENSKQKQMLLTVTRSKLFATFVLLFIDLSFTWIMVHTAGFWLMTGVMAFKRSRSGQDGYRLFLYGMSSLLLIAIVKIGQIDIDPAWFNRDDIAHLIMIGMYWMFFRGVLATTDMPKEVTHTS